MPNFASCGPAVVEIRSSKNFRPFFDHPFLGSNCFNFWNFWTKFGVLTLHKMTNKLHIVLCPVAQPLYIAKKNYISHESTFTQTPCAQSNIGSTPLLLRRYPGCLWRQHKATDTLLQIKIPMGHIHTNTRKCPNCLNLSI